VGEVVEQNLAGRQLCHESVGDDEPSEAQCGSERLGRAPDVDDAVGAKALERAHGFAVVAKLGVVVVLDDQAAGGAAPGKSRRVSSATIVRAAGSGTW
jgi:hypothetical protein